MSVKRPAYPFRFGLTELAFAGVLFGLFYALLQWLFRRELSLPGGENFLEQRIALALFSAALAFGPLYLSTRSATEAGEARFGGRLRILIVVYVVMVGILYVASVAVIALVFLVH